MPVQEFIESDLRKEIIAFREMEFRQLTENNYNKEANSMRIEYEAKVLDIDPVDLSELIIARGGQRIGEAFVRRYVYDITPGDAGRWIRLRDTGNKVTLTVKEIAHDGIDGTQEVEIIVSDFEATHELLGKLGFTPKAYQENRRISFILSGVRLEIDQH